MNLKAWLKEPLTHFLLAGGMVFLVTGALNAGSETGRTITVDDEDLMVFMQDRAQVYDAETFSNLLAELPADQREQLVADTALQEALYREAQSLGLADTDPLIRQRLVQQMRLLLMEEAAADMQANDAEARTYFEANRENYRRDPEITFNHVYFAGEGERRTAEAALVELRDSGTAATEAGSFGDRFLYQHNYAGVSQHLVSSHFGEDFSHRLFDLQPGAWRGPVQSEHGWHLVFPVRLTLASQPAFEDIAEQVRADTLADKRTRSGQQALDELMERYLVEYKGALAP